MVQIDYQKLDARVEELRGELIRDIQKWVSIPSIQSAAIPGKPFGEANAHMLDVALETAKSYGFDVRNVDYYAGDVTLGSGKETLGMLAHLDVVPVGEGWKHDPFGGELDGGKIFGRGTIDDKGPALCALYAMRAVRDAGVALKDGVRLILGCDEETGMSDMRYYASKYEMPGYGFSPDGGFPLINIEKGGLNVKLSKDCAGEDGAALPVYELYAGERANVVPGKARAVLGCADFEALSAAVNAAAAKLNLKLKLSALADGRAELEAEGVSVHGSLPELGVNAAGELLLALREIGAGGGCAEAIRMGAEVIGLEPDGKSLGVACEDEISHQLSCNLGILRFDGQKFEITLDIRFPLCTNQEKILGGIAMAVSSYGVSVLRESGRVPLHVPAEHKIVRGLLKVYHEVTGLESYAMAIGGGTYSRMMPNTVAFGAAFPDEEDLCHMPDEFIDVEHMMLAVKVYAHAIAELASGNIE